MLAFEPAAEEGGRHALPFLVALMVLDPFACAIGFTQQRERGIGVIFGHDAREGIVDRQFENGC